MYMVNCNTVAKNKKPKVFKSPKPKSARLSKEFLWNSKLSLLFSARSVSQIEKTINKEDTDLLKMATLSEGDITAAEECKISDANVTAANGENNCKLVWNLSVIDQIRFSRIFQHISKNKAYVTLDQVAKYFFMLSELQLIEIWYLCNPNQGILTKEQFTVFNWLLQEKERGISLPANLCNISKMPERYIEAVKCNKQNESQINENEKQQKSIELALNDIQTKFLRLNDAVSKHKQQCIEMKEILKNLKFQTENMLKSLYKREICITNEQIENDEISMKLQNAKEEIISLQQICASSVGAMQNKFHEMEMMQDKVEFLINETQDVNLHNFDESNKGASQCSDILQNSSNEYHAVDVLNFGNDLIDESSPLLDSSADNEEEK